MQLERALLVELSEPVVDANASKALKCATLCANVIILDNVRRYLRRLHLVLELSDQIDCVQLLPDPIGKVVVRAVPRVPLRLAPLAPR